MDNVRVYAAITTRGAPDWHVWVRTLATCQNAEKALGISAKVGVAPNKYAVHVARNLAVAGMEDATHLFFVDNDILLQRDALELLLSVPADIAVGCYAQLTQGGYVAPYIAVRYQGRWMSEPWEGILHDVEYAGAGCMLIRREVFQALEFPWWQWPLELENGKVKETSDDVDFCRRATAAGFKIAAHGNVFCGHAKEIDSAAMFVPGWSGPKTLQEQMTANEPVAVNH